MAESRHFDCPFCGRRLPLDRARVGEWLDCPACGREITVPDPRRLGIRQDEAGEDFSPLEVVTLEVEAPGVRRKIEQRAKRGCWRPAAMAVFLAERLRTLRQAILLSANDIQPAAAGVGNGSLDELDEGVAAFCRAVMAIHAWLCDRLPAELAEGDLVVLKDSADHAGRQVEIIAAFSHRVRQLHGDDPAGDELLTVTRGWGAFCLQAFASLMAQLHLEAKEADEKAPGGVLSISFFPPDMPRYLHLRRQFARHQ